MDRVTPRAPGLLLGPSLGVRQAIAAHRLGLGEARLDLTTQDPQAWLLAQIGAADPALGEGLVTASEGMTVYTDYIDEQQRQRRRQADAARTDTMMAASPDMATPGGAPNAMLSNEQRFVEHFRQVTQRDIRAHLATPATSLRPFIERMVLFWGNHFAVSINKPTTRSLAGAFEREAIRPHVAGPFAALLAATVRHPAMLRYLDNDLSVGPHSALVQRQNQRRTAQDPANASPAARINGLNENLARELLELHTLGAQAARRGIYTQSDVTAVARLLTGWRVPRPQAVASVSSGFAPTYFVAAWHEPGPKLVLGKHYPEGPEALDTLVQDLAMHPATIEFVCHKLARHCVADEPSASLLSAMRQAWQQSGGHLAKVYQALIEHADAWHESPSKLKSPVEYVVSAARALGLGAAMFTRGADAGLGLMGQRPLAAPSPAGWPDRSEEWLGPDAVWKRMEWTMRLAERVGRTMDARSAASTSLGPWLQPTTLSQIERAADGSQALALWLLAPEFQRR